MIRSVLLLAFVVWWILVVVFKVIRSLWNALHFGRAPIHDIEIGNRYNHNNVLPHQTGNRYNLNDALQNQTLPVQVSESVNNTPPVLDVNVEMSKPYVQSCRKVFPEEDVKTGIKYLNTLGGISRYRNHMNLSNAIQHVRRMREMKRINELGLPDDFSRESLVDILVRTRNNELNDVKHAVNQCLSEGFFPDPDECADKIREMKGIEELRAEVEETKIEIIHSNEVFAQSQNAMLQKLAESKLMIRDLKTKERNFELTIQGLKRQLRYCQDQQ